MLCTAWEITLYCPAEPTSSVLEWNVVSNRAEVSKLVQKENTTQSWGKCFNCVQDAIWTRKVWMLKNLSMGCSAFVNSNSNYWTVTESWHGLWSSKWCGFEQRAPSHSKQAKEHDFKKVHTWGVTIVVHALSIRGLSVTQFDSLRLCIPIHVSNEIDELLRGHFSLICVDLQFSYLFKGCKYFCSLSCWGIMVHNHLQIFLTVGYQLNVRWILHWEHQKCWLLLKFCLHILQDPAWRTCSRSKMTINL